MKYILTVLITFLTFIFSQVSVSDLNKLNNTQLDMLRNELNKSSDIKPNSNTNDSAEIKSISLEPSTSSRATSFFGYDYFKKSINFYDNIPTPVDFRLGPGDEIIISLWGETNFRQILTINKDGLIYYKNIGFINLSNMTLKEAENLLKNELAKIYSTLINGDSQIMLELGKLKSINVFFSGQIQNPGVNLVHPFSDVFTAIVQAGGVKNNGSLRNVQIIRNGETISTVDFYSFFATGKNDFSSIRIIDGDVIHIPTISNRVEINGSIRSPGFYEVLDSETITETVEFAGGLKEDASSSAILYKIIPLSEREADDIARDSQTLMVNDFSNLKLNNGDVLKVLSIPDVKSTVKVIGRVKNPGDFPAASNLKSVLDLAGGFNDPYFRNTIILDKIVVIRKDSKNFLSKEFITKYDDSNQFELKAGDLVFVYENINFENENYYNISGEVSQPGPYPYKKSLSIGDAINLAGGYTLLADSKSITYSVPNSSSTNLRNVDLSTKIVSGSEIKIGRKANFISVVGNVYQSGDIYIENSVTVSRAIVLAGGLKENSLKRKIYIERKNGKITKAPGLLSKNLKRLEAGDTLVIPENTDPQEFDITRFVADLSSTLANVAAILLVIENNS